MTQKIEIPDDQFRVEEIESVSPENHPRYLILVSVKLPIQNEKELKQEYMVTTVVAPEGEYDQEIKVGMQRLVDALNKAVQVGEYKVGVMGIDTFLDRDRVDEITFNTFSLLTRRKQDKTVASYNRSIKIQS